MSNNKEHINWEKLAAKLCTEPCQKTRNEQQLQNIDALKANWEAIPQQEIPPFNVDMAWDKVGAKMYSSPQRKKIFNPIIIRIAATILIITAIASAIFITSSSSSKKHKIYQTAEVDRPEIIKLKDGSVVVANSNTTLKTPISFSTTERLVSLDGEAFFNVKHQQDIPFVIETTEGNIRVTGTEFTIKTTEENTTEVYVKSGSVEIYKTNGNEKIELTPEDIGVITKDNLIKKKNTNVNYLAWKTRELRFSADKLQYVAQVIGDVYHKEISFNDTTLKPLLFTSTFTDEPLEDVLHTISTVFGFEVYATDKQIILGAKP